MWLSDLDALKHVGFSQARDQTCIPCIGRQILNYWITREVTPSLIFNLILCGHRADLYDLNLSKCIEIYFMVPNLSALVRVSCVSPKNV